MDNLNTSAKERDIEIEENIEDPNKKERPRWLPKITLNKYFGNRGMIEAINEKPKTTSNINHAKKVIAARREKNKVARRVRRLQAIRAGKKHCKLVKG